MAPGHITIIGGGPAGLAVGYYAAKAGIPSSVYEAKNIMGGNCITLRAGDFLFDSGAHRLHDQDPEITDEIQHLLGEDLREVVIPSYIYYNGKWIHFPLMPLNLVSKLGIAAFIKSAVQVLRNRLRFGYEPENFQDFVLYKYGAALSNQFLLNYSEKLWGLPCSRLSLEIAGKRLQGFYLKAFIKEALLGAKSAKHMEGRFFYPKYGIGQITEALENYISAKNCHPDHTITRIFHKDHRIDSIEINTRKRLNVDKVVSTLPLNTILAMLDPEPPQEIKQLASQIHYRHIILVVFFVNRPSLTNAATIYFPESVYPFTRIYEPKNRSRYLSPPEKTSLVAEIPAASDDPSWQKDENALMLTVRTQLTKTGLLPEDAIIGSKVYKLRDAYPVLETGYEKKVDRIHDYLEKFTNLTISGRNGRFVYSWIHDMMRFGKDIIENLQGDTSAGENDDPGG